MTKSQQQFVDTWGKAAARWGVPEDTGRALAFLYVMEDPYSAAELVKHLGIPKPRVREAVDTLLAWETIEVVEVEGMRGDFYLCALEAWDVVWRLSLRRGQQELAAAIESLEGLAAASKKDGAAHAYPHKRMVEALRWCRFLDHALEDFHKLPAFHLHSVTQLTGRVAGLFGLK